MRHSTGLSKPIAALLTLLGVAVVAEIDFLSGVELRVYPLYFLPIAFAAWYVGRSWTIAASALSTAAWLSSNYLAGLRYSAPLVWLFNSTMHTIAFLVVGLLIAQLKVSLTHERELSRLDPLTALLNVRAFHSEARRILSEARRRNRPLTIVYIDLDDFKAVNERFGHHGGDEILQHVAAAMRNCTRISDVGARIGGDEFVLLLPETGADEAAVALGRLRSRLSETLSAATPPVTASMGAVVFVAPPPSVDDMIRVADERMYAAKAAGKDQLQLDVVAAAVSAASG